jgi:hypothetical protein
MAYNPLMNIARKKPNTKSKKPLTRDYLQRWYVAVPAALVVLALLCFVFRGWIRATVVPDLYSVTYGSSINSTLNKEYNALGKPFDILGATNVKHTKTCQLVYAKGFHMEIDCSAMYSSFSDKVTSQSPSLADRAKTLEANLSKQNWQGGNTSITLLGSEIAKGTDWEPDAAYQKTIGKTQCLADFNTAFSKPKPPAIAGMVVCNRLFDLFGNLPQPSSMPPASCFNNSDYKCSFPSSAIDFYPSPGESYQNPDFKQNKGDLQRQILGTITNFSGNEVDIKASSGQIFKVFFPVDGVNWWNQARSGSYSGFQVGIGDPLMVGYAEQIGKKSTTITKEQINMSEILVQYSKETGTTGHLTNFSFQ